MGLIGRYVFRQTFSAMVLILLSLSGVVWIALALRQLKLVTSKGQDTLTLIQMTTLALPGLMALIAPVALMIAAIHVINRLNSDSELIIISASGGSVWRITRPLMTIAVLVSGLLVISNHFIMPWSLRTLREKVVEVRSDLLTQVLLPGRFSNPERGVIIHIRNRRLDGTLEGILMRDTRNPKELLTYLAEQGRIVKQDSGSSFLTMTNGHILRAKAIDTPPELLTFAQYGIDLERFERKLGETRWRARERYYSELAYPDPKEPGFKRNQGHYRAELHERLSSPLYPFVFVLIIVAYLGQARSTRQNRLQATASGFFVAAGFRLAGIAANNFVTLNAAAVPLLYLIPLTGIVLGTYWLIRPPNPNRRQGPISRLGNKLIEMTESVTASLRGRSNMSVER